MCYSPDYNANKADLVMNSFLRVQLCLVGKHICAYLDRSLFVTTNENVFFDLIWVFCAGIEKYLGKHAWRKGDLKPFYLSNYRAHAMIRVLKTPMYYL